MRGKIIKSDWTGEVGVYLCVWRYLVLIDMQLQVFLNELPF